MPHGGPYWFFEKENDMHTEAKWIWAFGDGCGHFKVLEITFLGRKTQKSVFPWLPPSQIHRRDLNPFGGAEYEKLSANGVNGRFGPTHGRRSVAMIVGPLQPRTATAPFTAATSAAL